MLAGGSPASDPPASKDPFYPPTQIICGLVDDLPDGSCMLVPEGDEGALGELQYVGVA
jgi:hypothetical protein